MTAWGALFDWDGVVIDSAAAHERSWELLAESEGLHLPPDHFLKGFGMRNEVIIPDQLEWTTDPDEIRRLSKRKELLYQDVVREEGVRVLPGAREYLESLRTAGIPAVVATSTQRSNVELIFDLEGLAPYFRDIVASEDVSHGKPDPEVFLKAAGKAGFPPRDCVVFEDAHHGVEAGLAGGMRVVGVLTTHPGGKLQGAHRLVNRLDELPRDGSRPV
jgi:HAD superfamily hydrolase (TIGR01509 family)